MLYPSDYWINSRRSIQDCVPPAGHAVPNDLALIARPVACSAGRAEDGAAASAVIRVPRARGAREHLPDAIPYSGAHRGPRSGARGLLGNLPAFCKVGFVTRHVAALGIDNGAVGAACEAERDSHEGGGLSVSSYAPLQDDK